MKKDKVANLFRLLGRRWLTADQAQIATGVRSLSQRVSEWRAEGNVIIDQWVEEGGSRFKKYKLLRPTRFTA